MLGEPGHRSDRAKIVVTVICTWVITRAGLGWGWMLDSSCVGIGFDCVVLSCIVLCCVWDWVVLCWLGLGWLGGVFVLL